jgi:hypothetical protein
MKTPLIRRFIPFVVLTALMCPVMADDPAAAAPNAQAAARPLNTEGARMFEVRNYRTGPGRTQVFMVVAEQQAVVKLVIDDTNTAGSVTLFAPETTEEAIGKWINNQHSCALYGDAPRPVFTGKLPDDACTILNTQKIGELAATIDDTPHHDYLVKLAVKAHEEPFQYTLEAFEVETKVYLKVSK